jgi:hypothetical protein
MTAKTASGRIFSVKLGDFGEFRRKFFPQINVEAPRFAECFSAALQKF